MSSVFTGNVNLLVAAPMLQDFLIDKDGTPMAGGTITCYHDNSRTTLKNWYYQSGTPGSYTYIALPNPLTLSAAGTICDINGVDTIPFFYPYDEQDETVKDPYFITIVNFAMTNQITRANFPFTGSGSGSSSSGVTLNNLITNGSFWRNIQPNTVNITPYTSVTLNTIMAIPPNGTNYSAVVAPSQHDGFRMPDIQFQKNNLSGTDAVTFTPFPLGFNQPMTNALVPEYYVSHSCSGVGTGETQKCYQFPISLHVNSLDSVPFTFSIEAQNSGGTGTGQNVITIFILQDTGTGGLAVAPIEIGQITLNSSWQLYTFTGIFNSSAGLSLGQGGDDGWYLQVQMPLNQACIINFTKPSIYLTNNVVPTNNFETYEQINSVINTPRTGDIRISVDSFYNATQRWVFGWVPMNDGGIGNASSNATTRANADTWRLFNLFWQLAKPFDTGSNFNAICQMLTSAGSPTNFGSTSIADFNANNIIILTHMMGRVIMGTVPSKAIITGTWQLPVTASNSSGTLLFTASSTAVMYRGMPINFTATGSLPGNIVATAIYYVTNLGAGGANTFEVSTTYALAISGTAVAYSSTGSGVSANTDNTGTITGEYAHTQLLSELVNHTHALSGFAGLAVDAPGSAGFTNVGTAAGTPATLGVTGFTSQKAFNITQPGVLYNIFVKL